MRYVVRLGSMSRSGKYLVTLEDEHGDEVLSEKQSRALRFPHRDFAELAAVALGDARPVRLRRKRCRA